MDGILAIGAGQAMRTGLRKTESAMSIIPGKRDPPPVSTTPAAQTSSIPAWRRFSQAAARPEEVPSTPEAFLHGLQRPTAFFVRGQDQKKLRVIAGSLHGNEPSGFRAIHRTLIDIAVRGERPATNVWFFVGGVEAAKHGANGLRMQPGRRDLNRCFAPPFDGIEGAVGDMALRLFREVPPEAVVDLHNNTGLNPAYTVTPALAAPHLWI